MAIPADEELVNILLSIPAESDKIEFKRLGEGDIKKIMRSIVAFSNTEGGRIILGIDDPEKTKLKGESRIYGIEENLENYDAIKREIIKIIPPITNYSCEEYGTKSGKTIAILSIHKSESSLHSWENQVWIRQKKGNKQLSPQEIIDFNYAKGFKKADEELVSIDFNLLKTKYFDEWRSSRDISGVDIEDILYKTGLARRDKGVILPTRAAVLLFSEYPNDILDTKCAVRIFKYSGNIETFEETPNILGIPKTINGPIIEQIKKVHEYMLSTLEQGISITSGFTVHYQIPSRVIKEAITNAIIHRDYHIQRDIEIRIFEDRVEVNSPGLFPSNITKANIGKVRALGYRNSLLVKHLREFPIPPNLDQNEGVRAMRSEMDKENMYPPIFMTFPLFQDSVRVVLFNEKVATEWEKVQSFLEKNIYITNEEARKILHIEHRDKMSRFFKQWTEKGLLIKIVPETGYVRGVKYKLSQSSEII